MVRSCRERGETENKACDENVECVWNLRSFGKLCVCMRCDTGCAVKEREREREQRVTPRKWDWISCEGTHKRGQ